MGSVILRITGITIKAREVIVDKTSAVQLAEAMRRIQRE